MAVLQIYDQLLQFPLFQGMSRDDLEIVAGHTRFGFSKLSSAKVSTVTEPFIRKYSWVQGSPSTTIFLPEYGEPVCYADPETLSARLAAFAPVFTGTRLPFLPRAFYVSGRS